MKNYQKKKLEKLLVENQLDKLKNTKADPNNIILNAAAFQQELLQEMGIKKKKMNYKKIIKKKQEENKNEDEIHIFLPKIINKTINDDKESAISLRRKDFLNNLSLAQKIGLKEIPKMPLSLQEWKNIEEKTISRNDHISNCPICLEPLSKRETMILSCTHIYHKTIYRNNMPKNKHLRSIYSIWKIKELTKNIVNAIESKNNNINKLIKKIEVENNKIEKINQDYEKKYIFSEKNNDPWEKILKEIKKRDDKCAICFSIMDNKQVYITSCSHCYHKNCLESFEKFDNYYGKRCPCCRQYYEKKLIKL